MNYEDEPYVRLYTRDSTSWLMLGWQGQTVLVHLIRKVDRAGVLNWHRLEPTAAVMLVTGLPRDVVAVGLQSLLDTETVTMGDSCLILSSFIEAQSAKTSDRVRQQMSRERRRAAVTRVTPVTNGNETTFETHTEPLSQAVTNSHSSLAELSLADPPLGPPEDSEHRARPDEPKARRRKPKTPYPPDLALTEEQRGRAAKLGIDADLELEKFQAHALAADRQCVNWGAALTQWLIRAGEYAAERRGKQGGIGNQRAQHGPNWNPQKASTNDVERMLRGGT
jgi:hypothetical protein